MAIYWIVEQVESEKKREDLTLLYALPGMCMQE